MSIGSTTARALEDADISIHRICVKPTPEDLMEALISLNKEPTIGWAWFHNKLITSEKTLDLHLWSWVCLISWSNVFLETSIVLG